MKHGFKRYQLMVLMILSGLFLLMHSCTGIDIADPKPDEVPAPRDYQMIAAGANHSLALSDISLSLHALMWSWGDNDYGQLGNQATMDKNIPIQIGIGYTAISAGGTHSLALDSDTLLAWGDNQYGQLGDSSLSNKTFPKQIGTGYAEIAAGGSHSLGVKLDGTLWAWGNNTYGQLGDGTFESRPYPVQIGSGFADVEAGARHSMGIRTDGSLWTWGSNEFGQLGDGSNEDRNTPVLIGSSYMKVAAGGYHSLAWKEGGDIWAWGKNEYGQLGDATNVDKNAPVLVIEIEPYANPSLAAGAEHSLVLVSPYELVVCGKNDVGQLGDGTLNNRNQWHEINQSAIAIAAGGSHSLALMQVVEYPGGIGPFFINHLWAWGANDAGQLGHGPTVPFSKVPLHIGPQ